ncbi:MAG TPA: hypothetical protein VG602_09170 [Actinomycetota bacterium]|nr:hypothetical protein [Actinomycetota bacterium]
MTDSSGKNINGILGRHVQGPGRGFLVASVPPSGPWEALRALRAGMRELEARGAAKFSSVTAITQDGHTVPLSDPNAEIVVLAYWLGDGSAPAGPAPEQV